MRPPFHFPLSPSKGNSNYWCTATLYPFLALYRLTSCLALSNPGRITSFTNKQLSPLPLFLDLEQDSPASSPILSLSPLHEVTFLFFPQPFRIPHYNYVYLLSYNEGSLPLSHALSLFPCLPGPPDRKRTMRRSVSVRCSFTRWQPIIRCNGDKRTRFPCIFRRLRLPRFLREPAGTLIERFYLPLFPGASFC